MSRSILFMLVASPHVRLIRTCVPPNEIFNSFGLRSEHAPDSVCALHINEVHLITRLYGTMTLPYTSLL